MKYLFFAALLLSTISAVAQKRPEVLATSTAMTFTSDSLTGEGRQLYDQQTEIIAQVRTRALTEMLAGIVLELEAKAMNSTPEKLIAAAKAKIPEPTAELIREVYDKNRSAVGDKSVDEVRPQIVQFLRSDAEQKAVQNYVQALQLRYKLSLGKDINAPDLKPLENVATVGTRSISAKEFEAKNKFELGDARAELYEQIRGSLEDAILSALLAEEAKSRGMDAGTLIAAEITDKMVSYTDEERATLEAALEKQLQEKYKVKILLKAPEPVARNVSVDDDPSFGNPAAPVTIVMFTDFQCPACSATHPVLKKVVAEYGDKVRLVVRDNPLERIHENSFLAARAAGAANIQGKFKEYIELLYTNQSALDKASLVRYAGELGLNVKQFELDLTSEKAAAEIRKDLADGSSYGVDGTPTIFVNGVRVQRLSADGFRRAIDAALARKMGNG
jgi:protein-disulfide isomerase